MEFYESRVYSAANADELKVGSRVIVADTLRELKDKVARDSVPDYLVKVRDDEMMDRFETADGYYCLAYLIEEAPALKWTDLKVGDVIHSLNKDSTIMVTRVDSYNKRFHIYAGDMWIEDEALKHFEKVQ